MNPSPLVSVAVATYKSDLDYLREAISSALSQDMTDLEVIVTDDSMDQGVEALSESFRDPRVRYRGNSPALGVARNHAVAFGEARGKYLAILNHDDRWHRKFLSTLTRPLENDDSLAASFCDHYLIDHLGRILEAETDRASAKWGRSTLPKGAHRPMTPLLAGQTIPMAMGCVFRRTLLDAGEPRQDAGPAYDFWITYLLARTGLGAYYCPERLSSWRIHGSNITSSRSVSWALGCWFCWSAILQDKKFSAIHDIARHRSSLALHAASIDSLRAGLRRQAYTLACKSLRLKVSARTASVCLLCGLPSRLRRLVTD